jgi:PLP dependent protein
VSSGFQTILKTSIECLIMDSIASKLQGISHAISRAAVNAQLPLKQITLVAVSKTQPSSAVIEALQAGQLDFGENYIQEGAEKIQALKPRFPQAVWHMIGPIQSNKTRLVAEHFDWVHTVDRLKIAERLSLQRPLALPALNVLIQLNIDEAPTKNGVPASQALALAKAVAALPGLKLRGLMCIPDKSSAQSFARMAQLLSELNAAGLGLDVLSMGMSADFEAAIAHGATHVRVGSAIFGARASAQPSSTEQA